MSVISIVGTSGVGKSFLVKQLASLGCDPAFFEGETGVIPSELFANVASSESPMRRARWFMERYGSNLERARRISELLNLNCWVDGSILSADAIITFEKQEYQSELRALVNGYRHLEADAIVLLTMNETKLLETIKQRGRASEQRQEVFDRALSIQKALLTLSEGNTKVFHLDRTQMDFSDENQLPQLHTNIINFITRRYEINR